MADATVETRELTPDLWPDVERLFGPRGACGGCWCMHWRLEKGEAWDDVKGAPAKARLEAMVRDGRAKGVLAYVDGEPVGWCSVGPKAEYPRLARSPTLRTDDAADVWAIPCFFVRAGMRGRGVGSALLDAAVDVVRRHGGRLAEGYPTSTREGRAPAAFVWTGTLPMFTRAGFAPAQERPAGKVRVRKDLGA